MKDRRTYSLIDVSFHGKKKKREISLSFFPLFSFVCVQVEKCRLETRGSYSSNIIAIENSLSVFLFFPLVLKHVLLLSLSSSRRFCFLLRRTNAEIWKNWNGRALKSRKYVPPHFHSKTQNSKGKLKKKKKRERERSSRFSKKKEALLRRERERERERRTLLQVLVLHLRIRSA